jgi:hypothetical protein
MLPLVRRICRNRPSLSLQKAPVWEMAKACPGSFSRPFMTRLLLAGVLVLLPCLSAPAQIVIPRLTGPVQLDGFSDEPAWAAVEPFTLVMHSPTYNIEPTERTEVRVAHDGLFLYVAARMFDSDPKGIRATSLRRDDASLTNDWIVITLDTFRDGENSTTIGVTPAGVRTDMAFNDVRQSFNFDWNTFWDAAVQRTDEGWVAEIRIPFSSLRFREENGRVEMGMTLWRNVARKSEISSFPAIRPDWGFNGIIKASEMTPIVLEGVRSRNPLYVIPYAIGGRSFVSPLNGAGLAYDRLHKTDYDIGIDAKYSLTSNLTLDLTYNTDFAQIEADDQQVNLTRFSLFFPEKRQFFQERSSLFDFSLGENSRLFYSRRIGLIRGQAVPLHGGGRLVGRLGGWELGVLNMQTAASELTSSENMGVFRLRRQVLNEGSTIGGILTSRQGDTGNIVYGLDSFLRLNGKDDLTVNFAQSFTRNEGPEIGLADRSFARLRLERRVQDGFQYWVDVSRLGAGFNPAMGFLQRTDHTRFAEKFSYGWRPGSASPILRYALAVQGDTYLRNTGGGVESASVGPVATLALKSGHSLELTATTQYEDLPSSFFIGPGVQVLAGSYTFHNVVATYTPSTGSLRRASLTVNAGSFFDGWRVTASTSPTWNISRHFELGGTYQFNRVRFDERDQEFTAHVARLRTRVSLSTRLTGAAFVQYNSASNSVFLNARVRYNPREGNDLYLVFNESLVTDRYGFEPIRPLSDSRAIMIKYIHTLNVGF